MINENSEEEEEENGEVGTEEVGIVESQQREYANNWRNMIASNMWTDAVGNGSSGDGETNYFCFAFFVFLW